MKKVLSLLLALVMTLSVVTFSAGAGEFTDDSSITYEEAVDVMYAIGIISGYENGSFNPAGSLTRGAAAKIICNMVLGPTVAGALVADTAPFDDVPANHTFAPYISYVSQKGIVNGYGDGTFHPAGTLTGFAFMKMVLGAIGYDPAMEGYVGDNWSVNVAKRGLDLGLNEGLVSEFQGGKMIDRQTAMLLAFNALQTELVKYDDKSNVTVGNISVDTVSTAKGTGMSFMDMYFPKLEKTPDYDPMGRPATRWMNDRTEIGLYVAAPAATFVGEVLGAKIYKELGVAQESVPVARYILDGVDKSSTIGGSVTPDGQAYHCGFTALSAKTKKSTGDFSVTTEVYYDEVSGTVDIIQIRPLIGEIVNVYEEDGERYVTVNSLLRKYRPHDGDFQTDKFDLGDKVLYTIDADAGEVQTMSYPKTYTGVVTKVAGSSTYYIDGTRYSRSLDLEDEGNLVDNLAMYPHYPISMHNTVTVYLAPSGEILWAELGARGASTQAVVLDAVADTDIYGNTTYLAKVLRVDGTVEEIETDKLYDTQENNLVNCKKTGGKYVLSGAAISKSGKVEIAKNSPQITVKGVSGYYTANNSTIFLVATEVDGEPVYNRYVGIKSVPDITGNVRMGTVSLAACPAGSTVAEIVYVKGADVAKTGNNDYIYVQGSSATAYVEDKFGGAYPYPAIIDGKVTTVYVDAPMSGNQMYTTLSYDETQSVELTASAAYLFSTNTADDEYTVKMTVTDPYKDGIIMLNGEGYSVGSGVQVWQVTDNSALSKEDTVAAASIKSVEDNAAVRVIMVDGALAVLIYYVDGATKTAITTPDSDDQTPPPVSGGSGDPVYDVNGDVDSANFDLLRIERDSVDRSKLKIVVTSPFKSTALTPANGYTYSISVYQGSLLVAKNSVSAKQKWKGNVGDEITLTANLETAVALDNREISGQLIVVADMTQKSTDYHCSEVLTLAADPSYIPDDALVFEDPAYPVPALAQEKMNYVTHMLRADLTYPSTGGLGFQITCDNPTGDYITNGSGWVNATIWDMQTGKVVGSTPNKTIQRWGSKDIGPRGNVIITAYMNAGITAEDLVGGLYKIQANIVIDPTTGGTEWTTTTTPTRDEMRALVQSKYDTLTAYTVTEIIEITNVQYPA